MQDLWIPITIAAALLQCVRTALQKRVRGVLSTNGANYVRYLYGAPVAAVLLWLALAATGQPMPTTTLSFWINCTLSGIAQIVATSLLIWAFSLRNFAVGTTYAKTETIQAALFSVILLGEHISGMAWFAIALGMAGVMLLSLPKGGQGLKGILLGWTEKSAVVGLASGTFFAISAVQVRASAQSLISDDFLAKASFTLATQTLLQTVMMTAFLAWREPEQLGASLRTWRVSGLVGLFGALGSICWFSAMTLQNVAYVRALGQIELVFTMVASGVFFRERTSMRELAGIALIVGGVVSLLSLR